VFNTSFLSKTSRNYDTIALRQLLQWSRIFGVELPEIPEGTFGDLDTVLAEELPELTRPTPEQVKAYEDFIIQLNQSFNRGEIDQLDKVYDRLPDAATKRSFRAKYPQLSQWWETWGAFYKQHPDIERLLVDVGAKEAPTFTGVEKAGPAPVSQTKTGPAVKASQPDRPLRTKEQFLRGLRPPRIPTPHRAPTSLPLGLDWTMLSPQMEEYFVLPSGQARRDYLNTHPELRQYFMLTPLPNYRLSYYDIIAGRGRFQPMPSFKFPKRIG
jgi:hypothetical protein